MTWGDTVHRSFQNRGNIHKWLNVSDGGNRGSGSRVGHTPELHTSHDCNDYTYLYVYDSLGSASSVYRVKVFPFDMVCMHGHLGAGILHFGGNPRNAYFTFSLVVTVTSLEKFEIFLYLTPTSFCFSQLSFVYIDYCRCTQLLSLLIKVLNFDRHLRESGTISNHITTTLTVQAHLCTLHRYHLVRLDLLSRSLT